MAPGLLLLDEPLSALDARVRVHLREELKQLQRRIGVTTIMVTHDQEEALAMADRIVVMNHGVIEQVGTPEEVYRNPATRLRRRFRRPHELPAGAAERERVGPHRRRELQADLAGVTAPSGGALTVCLRPEDVQVRGLQPAAAQRVEAENRQPGIPGRVLPRRASR